MQFLVYFLLASQEPTETKPGIQLASVVHSRVIMHACVGQCFLQFAFLATTHSSQIFTRQRKINQGLILYYKHTSMLRQQPNIVFSLKEWMGDKNRLTRSSKQENCRSAFRISSNISLYPATPHSDTHLTSGRLFKTGK